MTMYATLRKLFWKLLEHALICMYFGAYKKRKHSIFYLLENVTVKLECQIKIS